MARTNYPYSNSSNKTCSISNILVILNINRQDADLVSIRKKVKELLKKNNMDVCRTLRGSLDRLLAFYYNNDYALPLYKDVALYNNTCEVIDLI